MQTRVPNTRASSKRAPGTQPLGPIMPNTSHPIRNLMPNTYILKPYSRHQRQVLYLPCARPRPISGPRSTPIRVHLCLYPYPLPHPYLKACPDLDQDLDLDPHTYTYSYAHYLLTPISSSQPD